MLIINDRDRIEWRSGMTVRGVLEAMGYEYVLITVTVNGVLVPEDEYDTRTVPDAAEINVFHLAHGG